MAKDSYIVPEFSNHLRVGTSLAATTNNDYIFLNLNENSRMLKFFDSKRKYNISITKHISPKIFQSLMIIYKHPKNIMASHFLLH